ncbi:phage holin family protein, partial [Micromonospora provocatoris]
MTEPAPPGGDPTRPGPYPPGPASAPAHQPHGGVRGESAGARPAVL